MDMDVVPIKSESNFNALQTRYIITQMGNQQLVFPAQWVAEIILIELSQILNLPFYNSMILGVVHHQGSIVPLLSSLMLLSKKLDQDVRFRMTKETLTVIRLGQSLEKFAGVGIVVEKVVGSFAAEQLSDQQIFSVSDLPNQNLAATLEKTQILNTRLSDKFRSFILSG